MIRIFAGLSLLAFEFLGRVPWPTIWQWQLRFSDHPLLLEVLLLLAAVGLVAVCLRTSDLAGRLSDPAPGARLLGAGAWCWLLSKLVFAGGLAAILNTVAPDGGFFVLAMLLVLAPFAIAAAVLTNLLLLVGALRLVSNLAQRDA